MKPSTNLGLSHLRRDLEKKMFLLSMHALSAPLSAPQLRPSRSWLARGVASGQARAGGASVELAAAPRKTGEDGLRRQVTTRMWIVFGTLTDGI